MCRIVCAGNGLDSCLDYFDWKRLKGVLRVHVLFTGEEHPSESPHTRPSIRHSAAHQLAESLVMVVLLDSGLRMIWHKWHGMQQDRTSCWQVIRPETMGRAADDTSWRTAA